MKYRNDLKKRVLAGLFAGAALCLAAPAALAANSPIPNNTLPSGGSFVAGGNNENIVTNQAANRVDITQTAVNAVIKWDSFNVGANATVTFEKADGGKFNTLNYVTDKGGMSQIYGNINAENGNIYIVNPAGVEIGNSAQINVGSLYVSNRNLDEALKNINGENPDIPSIIGAGITQDTILMSLGNVNASNVTFDGGRIVIDTERLKDASGDNKLEAENIIVRTNDASNVVIGYDAYEETFNNTVDANTYEDKQKMASELAKVLDTNGNKVADFNAYMWVEDVEQLQAINTNLSGNYALRNSIDATATQDWNDTGTGTDIKEGFQSIGIDSNGNVIVSDGGKSGFTGKFDGLDYNIFNLNIKKDTDNVGLFGVVGEGAVINNVTLVGGSITGQNNVGALAGSVQGGVHISNITNSASVTGEKNVGGIVGESIGNDSQKTVYENLINTGTITSSGTEDGEGGRISNAGGLIGYLKEGNLGGTSYNLGAVTGRTENDGSMIVGYNVGGLVGKASDATLGDGTNLIYNRLNVNGAYNVGGIVGSMTGTTVQNAENSGNVTATGHTDGTYSYHSAHYASGGTTTADVYIANAGGIAGTASGESTISKVQNSGNVSSGTAKENSYTYYTAGNVGGIAGSAVDTNITNATNEENDIRGAHNVGGIAGYFSGKGTITTGINSGGDILATGARNDRGFVKEWVRAGTTGGEDAIIGNMGGIAGYMDGDGVYIVSSANRGTVHSQDITGNTVLPVSQAANVGGIVGKIDRSKTLSKDQLGDKYKYAAVSNSYNTGDVRGYMGVGGVAGMMYNGEIAGSYNLGTVNTTRNKDSFGSNDSYYTVNMGGIVGDTTEGTRASAVLYDVYNKGQIGDETFTYYARHVGGIVGRLSGTVEKAYNTGAIYNGYNVVGGIAGWMFTGSITNSFNTGNITVVNNERETASSQVGGIVGAASTNKSNVITNVYNLGTLRSFTGTGDGVKPGANTVGGIIGIINGDGSHQVSVTNAYTTGNIWADNWDSSFVGSIWGNSEVSENGTYRDVAVKNTYYIQPDPDLIDENRNPYFTTLYKNGGNQKDNSDTAIAYADRHKKNVWNFSTTGADDNGFSSQTGGDVTIASGQDWRIYDGNSLPILNAFLPNTEKYFSDKTDEKEPMKGIASIQYGTAYDPLLTIINAKQDTKNLTFDWQELGASNAAGIAVYGANLTLNDFMATGGSGYFGGLIYSDGALAINAHTDGETHNSENNEVTGNVALGSASQLYGSSVTISADGNVTIYGDVTATGNKQDGTTRKAGTYSEKEYLATDGGISITGGSVDVYGQLTSAKEGKPTKVPGINGMADGWTPGNVSDSTKPMMDIGDRFCYTTGASTATGSISITANETASEDGHVNVYYGHQQKGFLDTAGSLTVSGSGDVYMDSDLSIGGNLSITSPGEMILDISNIGKVQKDNGTVTDSLTGLHTFLHHFDKNGGTDKGTISFTGTEGKAVDAKITIDMWDDENNGFNLTKYNSSENDTLVGDLNNLNFSVSGADNVTAKDYTYIWVSTGEQLAGIQQAAKGNSDFLGYNFALKNDIDASAVTDYKAIGTGSAFTGTFDGRDHRIIGLNVTGGNAGIFDTIGADGKVEDLRVYSGIFNGTDNAGAVAGVNYGTIFNVTTFGNVVTAQGSSNSTEMPGDTDDTTVKVGAAGGIAGVNAGTIDNASASDAVTAAAGTDGALSTAGGIAGINQNGADIDQIGIFNSSSNSAVNASAESTYALGGIAGVNAGELSNVDSLGVTTGIYKGTNTLYSNNVGGIAGQNSGKVSEAYNESIVSGRDNVGGILGVNTGVSVTDVSNAARVTGEADTSDTSSDKTSDYVGGLAGTNSGTITNGRNNGTITGNQYVGGLVGNNASADSKLENLVNDEAASITGDNYVGGIAGRNYGMISANDEQLINRGSITGQTYVGGVAGSNEESGIITNTISSIALHVKTPYTPGQNESTAPKYFGGVVGQNSGTINGATNASSVDVAADGATMVGGIIGENTKSGKLAGDIANEGLVSGKSNVGGIIGSNENDGILNNTSNNRLVVSNSGRVQAEDGGAAGIFYNNTGVINNADLINTGMVIGGSKEDSITGGLFGTNSGTITNSTLINNGTVYGGGTVGGLIGKNEGDISTSSLINSVDGKVIGRNNVGGLIGQNDGTIAGGRDEKDNYYKYQIYNNGTIQVGKWNDSDQDGKIADGEITTDGVSGSNIGGLVGLNGYDEETKKTGSITAGYNTGAIDAAYSENVGGIAGTNTGTLDQVFNTVMTSDGQNQTITGGTSVGGIVGSNEAGGTVSNAYNTSTVNGNEHVGLIAGSNTSTAENSISNVYGTGAANLVGDGNATNVYDSNAKNFGTNGSVIDTTGESSASTVLWRQYGDKNPLLKVFLTTVKYDASKNNQNLVYNGKDQQLDIQGLINSGAFTAGEEGFTAHKNVSGGLIYHDVVDIDGGHKNAETYTDNLWSEQIKAGSKDDTFNPNNLGYDVQSVEYDINKAQITIDLDAVDRVYGNTTPIEGKGYGFNYDFSNVYEDAEATLREELEDKLTLGTVTADKDGALKDGGQKTSDAGKYAWEGTVTLADSLRNNYEIVLSDSQKGTIGENNTSITTTGDSNVEKATITVDLIDVNRTYGNAAINKTDTNANGNYGVANIEGVTNGDNYKEDSFTVDVKDGADGALTGSSTGRVTQNAGDYTYTGTVKGNDSEERLNNNYNIVVNGFEDNTGTGKSTVKKANLIVDIKDVDTTYGTKFDVNQYGYKLDGIVNGDAEESLKEEIGPVSYSNSAAKDGQNDVWTDNAGTHTDAVGIIKDDQELTESSTLLTNYVIKVDKGDAIVDKATITVGLDTVERTYGNATITNNDSKYSVDDDNILGLTNGDHYTAGDFTVAVGDGADGALAEDTSNGKVTSNVGDHYTYTGTVTSMNDSLNNNYNIVVDNSTLGNNTGTGNSKVNKAVIEVSAGSHEIYVGEPEPNYTGTDIGGQLVNGDTIDKNSYWYEPEKPVDTSQTGSAVIGIHFTDGSYYVAGGDWSDAWSGFKNYDVTFTHGTLTINDLPSGMPDISDSERWNTLLRDAPWDRNRNFRERKAEVHFLAGGMTL